MRVKVLTSRPVPQTIRELVSRMVRDRGQVETVHRREIAYWQERGWVQNGNRYTGAYQTPYGAFSGAIDQHGRRFFNFFIYQPPDKMQYHSHWTCFIDRGQGWYEVHMGRMPADISSGIMITERLLTEAFEQ